MEKKQYIIPATEIVETQTECLMEMSAALDTEQPINDPSEIGAREIYLWND